MARLLSALSVMVVALAVPSAAAAKTFQPGDLKLCDGAGHCVPLRAQPVLDSLSAFYYGSGRLTVAPPPRLGASSLRLVFPDGYVTGIAVHGSFLSYGVNLGRFQTGVWYRLPALASNALGRLSGSLSPGVLSTCAVSLSNTGPTRAELARCAAHPTQRLRNASS